MTACKVAYYYGYMKLRNLFRRNTSEVGLRIVELPDPPDSAVLAAASQLLYEFECKECPEELVGCRHEKAIDEASDWLTDVVTALRS